VERVDAYISATRRTVGVTAANIKCRMMIRSDRLPAIGTWPAKNGA
jgi:hypothetical protein